MTFCIFEITKQCFIFITDKTAMAFQQFFICLVAVICGTTGLRYSRYQGLLPSFDDVLNVPEDTFQGNKNNPYLPSGLFHPYQMDESISDFRGAWCTVLCLFDFC